LLLGGGLLLIVLFVVSGWALFLREEGDTAVVQDPDSAETGSVTISLPTVAPQPEENRDDSPPVESTATPRLPEPTRTPLIIPGLDIEVPHISDKEEVDIGREVAAEVEAEFGVYHNVEQLNRVADIGRAILHYVDRPHMPYTFTLLDTEEINAFAVPGGFIYITRGMLDFVQDDDELAGVISHEIAHIARRHGADRLEALALAEAGARWLLDRGDWLEDIYATEEGKFAAEMTTVLLLSGWSRQNEFEADEYGVIYMASAGYDPRAIIRLFNRMASTFGEGGENDPLTRLLNTHPPFADRIQRVELVIVEHNLDV
jgi:predicted Zn-dependent protease